NRSIDIANRMLEAADSCRSRKLVIGSMDAIPPELITYTGLTHLQLDGQMNADDVVQLIRRQRRLVSLHIDGLTLGDARTDFSIPESADHEPVPPLDTQVKRLSILRIERGELPELGARVLKYLLLRIPTLRSVTALFVHKEHI
ncbi:hypothetical protein H4R19_003488, partial [Coemansia spiralis]